MILAVLEPQLCFPYSEFETSLFLTIIECIGQLECTLPGLSEVFTWGDNANYTLGHKNIQRKFIVPELVSTFSKLPITVQQVGFLCTTIYQYQLKW